MNFVLRKNLPDLDYRLCGSHNNFKSITEQIVHSLHYYQHTLMALLPFIDKILH